MISKKIFKTLVTIIGALVIMVMAQSAEASNISSSQKYSQFMNLDADTNGTNDFINWKPQAAGPTVGAVVTDTGITGFIWGESVGWINLSPDSAGVTNTCDGELGGFAWGQNTGWINFAPSYATVAPSINPATGVISGQVWSQNFGWIQLSSPDPSFPGLVVDWNGCEGGDENDGGPQSGSIPPGTNNPPQTQIPPGSAPTGPGSNPTTPPPFVNPPQNPGTGGTPSQGSTGSGVTNTGGSNTSAPTNNNFLNINQVVGSDPSTAAVIALAVLGVVGVASSIPALAPRFANIFLTFLFARKKMRGVVYDSVTKEPIDPAYVTVIDAFTNQEVATMFTDLEGRYGFVLKKGSYKMTAQKTHYAFPSTRLLGKVKDEVYDQLYFGDVFTVENEEEVVTWNIPMDPTGTDWNQEEKRRMNIVKWFIKNPKFTTQLFTILFTVGFFASIIITYFYPVWWNIVMLVLYIVIALAQVTGYGTIHSGKITKNGVPVAHAIIRVFGATLRREIAHKITTDLGGYYVLVPKADYYITVEEKNSDGTYTVLFTSPVMTARHGLINKSFDI